MLTPAKAKALLKRIKYKRGFELKLDFITSELAALTINTKIVDSTTGRKYPTGIKRIIELTNIDETAFVRAVFVTLSGWEQHECQEFFKVDKRAIYSPHVNFERLIDEC